MSRPSSPGSVSRGGTPVAAKNSLKVLALTLWASAAPAPVVAADAASLACSVIDTRFKYRDVSCALPGSSEPRTYRFRAFFSGGHDDSEVSLIPVTAGSLPLACGAGSKPELTGEYGDIHVDCVVSTGPLAEGEKTFSAKVVWSHAVFRGVEMVRE